MSGQLIVTTEWLENHRTDANIRILDVTLYSDKEAVEDYKREHIPGALHFDIFKDVEQTPQNPRALPKPEDFQKQARACGVNNDSHVVLYDSEGKCGFFNGGRGWLNFTYFGHPTVSVLDGGLQKWKKDGYKVTSDIPNVADGNFTANVDANVSKTFDFMRENLKSKQYQILDSRHAELYMGNPSDKTSGHYPGALSLPFGPSLLNIPNGTIKSQQEILKVFTEKGVSLDKPTIVMCNSGMGSCSLLIALRQAGCKDCSIYQPGFTEWKSLASEAEIEQA